MEKFAALIGLLFVLFALEVQCSDSDLDFVINNIRNSGCLEKTNVTLEEALNYSPEEAETNPRLQCYISCRLEDDGLISGCDIGIVPEENKELVYEVYESCRIAAQASEQCDCGFKWSKCITDLLKYLFREQN